MQVIEILGEKGNAVETAPPETPVSDIIGLLGGKKIGVIVITEGDNVPVGIISERDIVRGMATEGPAIINEPVSQIMTTGVETCAPNEDITDLMIKMVFGHIRHLPVMDGAAMTGIVSIGDVVKAGMRELKIKSDIIQGYIIQPMADVGDD